MTRQWRIRAAGLAVFIVPGLAVTDAAPTLKAIMQGLRDNVVEIADGLLNDNYDQVARGATSIAEHPRIAPAEVAVVASALGAEMPAFKGLDDAVHDLSIDIRNAAEARNREAVISGYQRLIEGCLACHSAYKARVAAALSPEQQ